MLDKSLCLLKVSHLPHGAPAGHLKSTVSLGPSLCMPSGRGTLSADERGRGQTVSLALCNDPLGKDQELGHWRCWH